MFNLQKGFPENFKWGSSTNAQQFEGGYKEGGNGLPNLSFYNGLVENFPERRRNRTKRCWS